MKMKNYAKTQVIALMICIIAAFCSITILGNRFSKPESYASITEYLDQKKTNVEELAGSAAAASAAITLMPGDFGTPIADKLADLSGYFLLILVAIYIEKFLVSVVGLLVFDLSLPIGFVLLGISSYIGTPLRRFALKLIALSCVLAFLVPVSVGISDSVEKQYQTEIQQTIDNANANSESIQGVSNQADQDNSSVWETFINKVKGGSETLLNKFKNILNNFIDTIAVYIVTSCIIPAVTFILGIWLIKTLLNVNLPPLVLMKGSDVTRAYRRMVKQVNPADADHEEQD